jgi:hypothetical protein
MNTRPGFARVWAAPSLLAALSIGGLLGALLGESLPWKAVAWTALAVPVLLAAHAIYPRRIGNKNS